jgi:hypothetical protein
MKQETASQPDLKIFMETSITKNSSFHLAAVTTNEALKEETAMAFPVERSQDREGNVLSILEEREEEKEEEKVPPED